MRPNHEILKVFLDNQHLFDLGLCNWIVWLKAHRLLSKDEGLAVLSLIEEEFQERGYEFWNRPSYLWPKGEIEPRINFLKEKLLFT